MIDRSMTSLERVLTTLGHKEPDRVPFFLLLTMHGAKELGLSIENYYSDSRNVVEGQLRLREKYQHDCYFPFFYAGIEVEAWGGEIIFSEDCPPNAGEPILKNFDQIDAFSPPEIRNNPPLQKVLATIKELKQKVGDDAPIIGVALSPFSLPVMQLGFDKYLDLMIEQPQRFEKLMRVNEAFCVAWANAQLAAGATAICYFDPVSSTTIITPEMYKQLGQPIAKRVIAQIKGPTATHFASGRCLPILPDVMDTGTAIIGFSKDEDAAVVKKICEKKLTILGNLNGVEMRRWTVSDAEAKVKELIFNAAPGGGFILSDNHGEIPFQVTDDVLTAISETVHDWGEYPIRKTR
jgi:uroporphyrinogen decarboxylase